MKIGKKKLLKWVETESRKLPEMYYEAYHKYAFPMQQNIAAEGEEPNIQAIYGYVQKHRVNHKRRLKRVYQRYGIEEVHRYFALYGFVLVDEKEKGAE